ncbi:pilus assembly protein CpaD [Mesorhizobium albiziae]|uniref:Pilus assembly protein CpaD n=1 Tax=Neomesorhizobium albiziae TaxID=335020 RepID=A0A1I3WFC5_9HYPH|nr:CpaD family pilus assembly protein [Mesorhizobium albiziae]GLS31584.1 pilus biogenesis lipoprotein CpaD [Mesorhizobium albiziae]SFK06205.1 pilus assembly protein CpaD [Mesorhizobium albiziae]
MSKALKNSAIAGGSRGFPTFRAISVLAVVGAALLAGCAKRDSITVGSVPDDYRTNHPIVIGEKEEVLDLPVGASDRGMTNQQRASLEGFLSGYDRSAAPVLRIMTPSGAANDVAASRAASDFARVARANGVPASRLMMLSYQSAADVSAPVRVAYTAMKAQTGKCGRWPEDILKTEENKHYADFGCSYQNNLAAQIANPADLLGPRKETPIDAARRGKVIDGYRNAPVWVAVPAQEVDY